MAYRIPVIYGISYNIGDSLKLSDWHDGIRLLEKKDNWQNPSQNGICVCTCRNWWHQDLLDRICQGKDINGLEFACLNQYWGCLGGKDLQIAHRGIKQVIQLLSSGLSFLGMYENETVIDLRQNIKALEKAKVKIEIDSPDWGFEAAKCFCSHLKTLHFMIEEAINQNANLIYILPPP